VDAVASDYLDDITFLAIAGSSTPEKSAARVGDWFDPYRILWAYSDELWGTYLVPYQPVSVLISSDDVIVERWFGAVGEAELRAALDRLRSIG
jgi:hypothetical protein